MKKELLIAILLLAAGGWLWQGGGIEQIRAYSRSVESNNTSVSGPEGLDSLTLNSSDADEVDQALSDANDTRSGEGSSFLQAVAANLKQSQPFQTELVVEFNGAGQRLQLNGRYAQAGQGSGQSRLELKLDGPAPIAKVIKICDGRFLYTHLSQGDQQSLEFIDLQRIKTARKASTPTAPQVFPGITGPVEGVLDGCLASLLENLALAFEFEEPQTVDVEGISICTLRGRWKPGYIAALTGDTSANLGADLPVRIPGQVQLQLANVPKYGWVPQTVAFVSQRRNLTGQHTILLDARFSPPRPLKSDAETFLHIQNDEVESIDMTDRYVDHILGVDIELAEAVEE